MTDRTTQAAVRELLGFRLGALKFCIDVMAVREIRGWSASSPIPMSPPYVLGAINMRGTVLPIIDLAARLGLPTAEPTARNAVIIVEMGSQIAGLMVDGVSDIMVVAANQIQPTPQVASDMARHFVRGVIALNDGLVSVVAGEAVLPPAESLAA